MHAASGQRMLWLLYKHSTVSSVILFFHCLVFLSPSDNTIGRNHCCIAFRRTAQRRQRHRENQNETRTKKKRWHGQHWGEDASTVHRHQIKDKMKKKNQLYFLPGRTKKKTTEKRNDGLLNLRTMKSCAVYNFEFFISHCETGLCLQRKQRRHRLTP